MLLKKMIWQGLNHLRFWMVQHHLRGRWINPITRACDALWWGD